MTYSLGITGARSSSLPFQVKNLTLSDDAAQPGSIASNARTGLPFLCKRPDGGQGWFAVDAERSTPTTVVLKPVPR